MKYIKEYNQVTSMRPNGIWHLSTDKIEDFPFYHGYSDKNPLQPSTVFDRGDYWIIDAGSEDSKIREYYKEDPEDDSFVLIPKSEVTKCWFVYYGGEPRLIKKSLG